jgi:hypothetical protein
MIKIEVLKYSELLRSYFVSTENQCEFLWGLTWKSAVKLQDVTV